MGRSGLGSGIDKDRPDYIVFTGEWEIGRIYQTRGGPDSLRWFWYMNANGPMTRSDRVATLEEAKAQFQKCWDNGRRGQSSRKPNEGWLSSARRSSHVLDYGS
jgi:hypothetical protein